MAEVFFVKRWLAVEQNLTLDKVVSIEGTLLMLDNTTPHVAVPVQAIRGGEVMATTLSDESGQYRFTNLERERYQVRCQVLGGYAYYGEGGSTVTDEDRAVFLQVKDGVTRDNIDFRFAPFKKGTWKTYNYLDGLAHNVVRFIYRSPGGFLWFGTRDGVSRYDGKEFVNLTTRDGLAHNEVWCGCVEPDGVMWFGTRGGVSRYDGKEFVNFTTEDGLANNYVTAIHRDPDGVLWFGTGWRNAPGKGVSRYDGRGMGDFPHFVNFTTEDGLADNTVLSIYHGSDGAMWFGTLDSGVCCYDGKEFRTYNADDGLVGNRVDVVHGDPDGTMWFGASGRGISRYDGKEFVNITRRDGLASNLPFVIYRDADGLLWFGTGMFELPGGGISRYDGRTFVNFTVQDGLVSNAIYSIYRDSDGIMWFGTDESGVSRYDSSGLMNFTTRDGLAGNNIRSIYLAPDGDVWFATDGGVSRYDRKKFINLTTSDGLLTNNTSAVCHDSNGALWVGTLGSGVSRYDGNRFVNFTLEEALRFQATRFGSYVSNLAHCEHDGSVWFGAYGKVADGGGAYRYDGREFTRFTEEDGLPDSWVRIICHTPDGVTWFGTRDGGVSRYDGKGFRNFTTEDGLVSNWVRAIYYAPDGVMWFGTAGGVSRYDGKEFLNFTVEDGLASNTVEAIHAASDGTMWFGTSEGGVSRYDGVNWVSLDTRDGLAGDYVSAIQEDEDGSMWIGTKEGVTRYRTSRTRPAVRIVSVKTDREYRDLQAIPAIQVGNRVTIEYSAIDFKTVPEKRQYRCCIGEARGDEHAPPLPCSPAPSYLPPTRNTTFDWIPREPGAYTFQVQAIDRDLNYSEPAALSLTVQLDPSLVSLRTELNHLRQEARKEYDFQNIIGNSDGMERVRMLMERAIDSDLAVLITGETGTGKELVAQAIHHNSSRKDGPLLARNCGAIPKDLLAGDLFGHRKGAFTGADADRMGLFEAASGGTILLDEIGEMPQDAQVHLLRVLEERKVQRLGEHTSRDVDVRIIAMTNKDLRREVADGGFREDLYYRLSVFPISVPPLRERADDIPLLAEHFLHKACVQQNKAIDGFAPGVIEMLTSYNWPGNVRELQNAMDLAAALVEEGGRIQRNHFPSQIAQGDSLIQEMASGKMGYQESLERFRRRLVEDALLESGGNRNKAAKQLGMDPSNLRALIKRLGIET
jgi:DNA-binding NtrC family response regulator/ligand-binding sensor domain-containing protein